MSDTQLPLSVVTLIQLALMEDVGPGDVTSKYFVPEDATCSARIFAKEDGVTAGIEVAAEVFRQVDDLQSGQVGHDRQRSL